MDIISILQIIMPVITFAMGYFLTNIGYKRDRKLSIVREKFEKLHHPFYMLLLELGTDVEEGISFDIEDGSVLRRLLDHLMSNAYLASPEGQKLIEETRYLFVCCMAENNSIIDEEKERQFDKPFNALIQHMMQEYIKSAKALGYEAGD